MVHDQKTPEAAVQLPEMKVLENGTMSGPLVGEELRIHLSVGVRRKVDLAQVIVRLLCMVTSVLALLFMVTAKEANTVLIYGFQLPVYSKWSFSESFEYLVGVAAAVAAHSLLQLLIGTSRLLKRSPVIPSRNYAWLIFAGDQVFAYAMMSAGSAASGVTNLNRTGIRHTALPNFCKPLHIFCDHVAISIAFTFFSCFWLATSAVQDVIWLSRN
ncbi:CASP-like protein [Quillaja saponaria]|uniref:CASP-like protein n=1 Tax=Quillaja saponaria TaxID=32244 RepID=A0AAD7L5S6_QUISA|nr:CASP-like protein [Quillaja saponaria]